MNYNKSRTKEALLVRINESKTSPAYEPLREWLLLEIDKSTDMFVTAEGNELYRLQGRVGTLKEILQSINGLSRPSIRVAD